MSNKNIVAILLLLGIAVLGWVLLSEEDYGVVAEKRLAARAQEYAALREANDWQELYKLTDPRQRERMKLAKFLTAYGTGILKVNKAEVEQYDFDRKKTVAKTLIKIDAELVPANLPTQFRNSLRVDDPSALRKQETLGIDWVWRDGQWYFLMDSEVTTGVNEEGKTLNLGGQGPVPPGAPAGAGQPRGK